MMSWQNLLQDMGSKNNNKKSKIPKGKKILKSKFQLAVEGTVDVKNGYRRGLQAVKSCDLDKIDVSSPRELQGSLDIDSQMKNKEHDANRWDYVLSFCNKLYFFEIHPAETSEVDKMILKLSWLRNWLNNSAPLIEAMPKADVPYTWVQSGRGGILPTAKVKLKLSQAGIVTTKILRLVEKIKK